MPALMLFIMSLHEAQHNPICSQYFSAFPSDVLHTYYMVVTYQFASSVVIVGTEDNTTVSQSGPLVIHILAMIAPSYKL